MSYTIICKKRPEYTILGESTISGKKLRKARSFHLLRQDLQKQRLWPDILCLRDEARTG